MLWDARPHARSSGKRNLPAMTASATTAETNSPEHIGNRRLRLQLRQHRQPQDGSGTGRGTHLHGQRTQPVHQHRQLHSQLSTPPTLEHPFVPQYDASGNQTLIKTSTGIWTVVYNAANRAVGFTSQDGATVVECGYDYQGRRYMKKVTVNGTVTSHERYLYRGYLQLAALDMLNRRNVLRTLLWDPLEPMATRPLALVQDNALYCYGVDFNKNVTEVFDAQGTIATAYDYSPYGTVTKAGDLIQPVQWSSEMNDEDLELVYYNYRYYNPADGRWINRDPIAEQGDWNLYGFVRNNLNIDNLGLLSNDGSGTVIPNTETEGNCIGIACETTKPLSPDPEKIPKNVDLNTFLDIIREILIGDCTRMEKNSTQNETQCQECEREIICLAYFITKQSELILKFIV